MADIIWLFTLFWYHHGKNDACILHFQQSDSKEKGSPIFTGFWYHISTLFIQKVKDLHLFVFIGALITVDLLILVIYTFVQGVNGNINAQKSVNTERPSDEEGVSIKTTSPVITFLISIYLIIGSSC